MKALSLTQPWATLVAIGAKRFETRSWKTNYCGPLAIHAAKRLPVNWREFGKEPFLSALEAISGLNEFGVPNLEALPRGAILCTVELTGCFATPSGAEWRLVPLANDLLIPPPEPERSFGDYGPSRYAWRLENLCVLPEPIPWRGSQGLFNVTLPLEATA